ncbi:YihY/virulence factor BrkB family protein [Tomitella gaofuii]|uniref:YihY/virulence factor BrkB family protein n=1 Tax=Tomitella gaofuii TaxID=2760083 RepID=UPI0015FDB261|nr:YihY/virulence factor BrkB family protein [Tomitella gaofuii]
MSARTRLIDRVDRFQRAHPWAGFSFAVIKKFGDDQAGNLAALTAYYAFFSIFPLLLALTTILGYVLAGSPELQDTVFSSALGEFPLLGEHSAVRPLTGNPLALITGLALALWSGLGVAQTAQTAFNTIYAVPRTSWPGFVPRIVRSIELVAVGGGGLIATTFLQGVVSGTASYGLRIGAAGATLAAALGLAMNFTVFTYLFRRLTVAPVGFRDAAPGAAAAALAWFALQKIGTSLVNHKVQGATGTYGTFAVVIGLLFWFYLLAQITMVCAEINVVRSDRLWPRGLSSLSAQATTRADVRAYSAYTRRETQAHNVEVTTRLTAPDEADSPEPRPDTTTTTTDTRQDTPPDAPAGSDTRADSGAEVSATCTDAEDTGSSEAADARGAVETPTAPLHRPRTRTSPPPDDARDGDR